MTSLTDTSVLATAQYFLDTSRPERALEQLEKLSTSGAVCEDALEIRGLAFMHLEEYERATSALTAGLEEHPHSAGLQFLLAQALCFSGRSGEAGELTERLIASNPDDPRHFAFYAFLAAKHRRPFLANKRLKQALTLAPMDNYVMTVAMDISACLGKRREAIKRAKKVLEYYPEDTYARFRLGTFESQNMRYLAASRHLRAAAGDRPTYSPYIYAARSIDPRHPLMLPLLPMSYLGDGPAFVLLFVLVILGMIAFPGAMIHLLFFLLGYTVYMLVVPKALGRWLAWREATRDPSRAGEFDLHGWRKALMLPLWPFYSTGTLFLVQAAGIFLLFPLPGSLILLSVMSVAFPHMGLLIDTMWVCYIVYQIYAWIIPLVIRIRRKSPDDSGKN